MKTMFDKFLQDSENRRAYQQEKLIVDATEMIASLMERSGVTRAELAKRIGKSRAFVTQVLRGPHNLTLRTLADLLWALESEVTLQASTLARTHAARPVSPRSRHETVTSRIAALRTRGKRSAGSRSRRLKRA